MSITSFYQKNIPYFGHQALKGHVHGPNCKHHHEVPHVHSANGNHHHHTSSPKTKISQHKIAPLYWIQRAGQLVLQWFRELFSGLLKDFKTLLKDPEQTQSDSHSHDSQGPHSHSHHH
jgi:hypothetical protein